MSPTRPLRIVVADDQASVRQGLVLMLDLLPDIDVVAAAGDGRQAVELVAQHLPDAILLDLHMPVLNGVETTSLLRAQYPDVAVVILTTFADDESVLGAMRAGARSYLTKDTDRLDIAQALHSATQGLSVMDPVVHEVLLASSSSSPPDARTATSTPPPDGLTPREIQILIMIAAGHTNTEIAEHLVLSNHTIKSHINRIFHKTASRDRAAAIVYARQNGLV